MTEPDMMNIYWTKINMRAAGCGQPSNLSSDFPLEPINLSTEGCKQIEPGSGLHFFGSYKLSDWPFCVCATNLK